MSINTQSCPDNYNHTGGPGVKHQVSYISHGGFSICIAIDWQKELRGGGTGSRTAFSCDIRDLCAAQRSGNLFYGNSSARVQIFIYSCVITWPEWIHKTYISTVLAM